MQRLLSTQRSVFQLENLDVTVQSTKTCRVLFKYVKEYALLSEYHRLCHGVHTKPFLRIMKNKMVLCTAQISDGLLCMRVNVDFQFVPIDPPYKNTAYHQQKKMCVYSHHQYNFDVIASLLHIYKMKFMKCLIT